MPGVDELGARLQGAERAGEDGRDGDLVGDERGRVVDQRLALDDRHDAAGDADAAGDRGGGDGVGGGDDRAEHEGGGPRHAVDHRVGDERDRSAVASTSPIASMLIGRMFWRRSRRPVKKLAL